MENGQLEKRIDTLYNFLENLIGRGQMAERKRRLECQVLMRSYSVADRILALHRLVFNEPHLKDPLPKDNYEQLMNQVEERLAELVVHSVEG